MPENKITCIYLITNPLGMVYVGQTTDFKKRVNAYRLGKTKSQPRIHKSIKDFGFENHSFKILQECPLSELNTKERFYQDIYNVTDVLGLNCRLTRSENHRGVMREDTKDKISKSLIGRKRPIHVIDRLREVNKGKVLPMSTREKMSKNNARYNKGRDFSFDTRSKISLNNKMKRLVVNIETGIFYDSIKEAADSEGINYSTLRAILSKSIKSKIKISYI